jgi:phage shock protein PspC (stress-responsive transcriptional regulator)
MIKTVTVNLAGQVFHIDENAFEKLSSYLKAIKNMYSKEEGGEEILSDIESRIAEVFISKLKESSREVINMNDVEYIISTLGKPEEFESENLENGYDATTGQNDKSNKRLYRNADDQFIAGVCSGLSAYLGINDHLWMRLIFVLLVITGFGTGILIYIILWILVPEAKSAAQKLQMRGERVNIENIEKNFKQGVSNIENKLDSINGGKTIKNIANQSTSILRRLINVAFIIIKGFIIFITTIVVFSLVVTLMALAISGFVSTPLLNTYLFETSTMGYVATVGLLTILVVTALFFILLPFQIFSRKTKPFRKEVSLTMLTLWFLGLIMVSVGSADTLRQFVVKEKIVNTTAFESPVALDTLIIRTASLSPNDAKNVSISIGWKKYQIDQEGEFMNKVKLYIEPSDNNQLKLVETYSSRGANSANAIKNVKNIAYNYKLDNKHIIFDDFISTNDGSGKWRNQSLKLKLHIPENTVVVFRNISHMIEEVPLKGYDEFDTKLLKSTLWKMQNEELISLDSSSASTNAIIQ